MLTAVELHNQLRAVTDEVDIVPTHRRLASEMQSFHFEHAELTP